MTVRVGVLALILASSSGCAVVPRDGAFACTRDDQCPETFVCVELVCTRSTPPVDAWDAVDAPRDARSSNDGDVDAISRDAPTRDAPSVATEDTGGGCLAPGLGVVGMRTIAVDGVEELFDLLAVTSDGDLRLPMAWNGTFDVGASDLVSTLGDGLLLRVPSDLAAPTIDHTLSGAGAQTLSAFAWLDGQSIYGGTTDHGISLGTASLAVEGPAAFVHAPGAVTAVVGGQATTSHTSLRDLVPLSDARFCAAGVVRGAVTATTMMTGDGAFLLCGGVAMTSEASTLASVDGSGNDAINALAAGPPGWLYVAGTLTDGTVLPGQPPVSLPMRGEGRAFVARIASDLSTSTAYVFGVDGTGAFQRSVVHDLVATDTGVYFVGELGRGSSLAGHDVTVGTDAVAGHITFGSGSPRLDWAMTHDVADLDAHVRGAVDVCGNLIAAGAVGSRASDTTGGEYRPIVSVYGPAGDLLRQEVGGPGATITGVAAAHDSLYLAGRLRASSATFLGRTVDEPADIFLFRLR